MNRAFRLATAITITASAICLAAELTANPAVWTIIANTAALLFCIAALLRSDRA